MQYYQPLACKYEMMKFLWLLQKNEMVLELLGLTLNI